MNSIESKQNCRESIENICKAGMNEMDLPYCRRNEGLSKIFRKVHIIVSANKISNFHYIGAVCSTQIVSFGHRRGSYKAEDFRAWRSLIEACQNTGIF